MYSRGHHKAAVFLMDLPKNMILGTVQLLPFDKDGFYSLFDYHYMNMKVYSLCQLQGYLLQWYSRFTRSHDTLSTLT